MSEKEMSTFGYALLENYEVYGNTEDEEYLHTRDTLIQYIAELEAERRWIPVGERRPKKGEFTLTICAASVIDVLEYFGTEWRDCIDQPIRVTHWMPLPTPPEATHDR